ncbi:acyl-CoA thioesterase [Rhodoferax sp.]|jgi:4-hydroxybenzoyl-CoA thioesterase|uniref:acyl-CoA thioesterase n=1 Tax=Rhodoferax sp. TaxID=50421 RepID=UPI0027301ECB|nr:thioesterase family protein [Rhodoferax sp.]MDP1527773.1 thioesterase family protein [Rhodoferax sp.]MDP1942473.1 thioesterase family protein [Rhodoferax sp.]MDP2440393.1 thioesterase family protein [Rhodoferax sp.]MDZ4206246.1 thioesterase family protein [Rhodoferax sp.]
MARIQIRLPSHFAFSTELMLYQSHMNYGGHLDNALLLTLVSEARVRFFQSLGYTELDIEGAGIVVSDAALQYRSEAFHGELMVVRMAASDVGRKGFDMVWSMTEQSSQREVARGKTGIVFFNYETRKTAPMPAAFRDKLAAFKAPSALALAEDEAYSIAA